MQIGGRLPSTGDLGGNGGRLEGVDLLFWGNEDILNLTVVTTAQLRIY